MVIRQLISFALMLTLVLPVWGSPCCCAAEASVPMELASVADTEAHCPLCGLGDADSSDVPAPTSAPCECPDCDCRIPAATAPAVVAPPMTVALTAAPPVVMHDVQPQWGPNVSMHPLLRPPRA